MLIKQWLRRGVALAASAALCGTMMAGTALAEEQAYEQPELNPRVKSIIEVDGYQFIDLNSNGALDPYEDWRSGATRKASACC